MLVYATVDADLDAVRSRFRGSSTQVFGATSFQGVFTPLGFRRGAWGLGWEAGDGIRVAHELVATDATHARMQVEAAVRRLQRSLGRRPDAALVHATPGFEERVLEGMAAAGWGEGVMVYGGSAADDDLGGNWKVFDANAELSEGVLIVAMACDRPVYGDFVSGYFGTKRTGRITRCEGRTVYTIDHRPAAEVLDGWMDGALGDVRRTGGVVLAETTLSPIGRVVDRTHRVPRYLLSHPHVVHADTQAVSFFTDMAVGDELELMMASRGSLLARTEQVVDSRARTERPSPARRRRAHLLRGLRRRDRGRHRLGRAGVLGPDRRRSLHRRRDVRGDRHVHGPRRARHPARQPDVRRAPLRLSGTPRRARIGSGVAERSRRTFSARPQGPSVACPAAWIRCATRGSRAHRVEPRVQPRVRPTALRPVQVT